MKSTVMKSTNKELQKSTENYIKVNTSSLWWGSRWTAHLMALTSPELEAIYSFSDLGVDVPLEV